METQAIKGHYRGVRKVEEEDVYTFIASTDSPDRHGTVLNQSGWELKNFNDNPIIGYQHNLYGDMCSPADPDDVVGKGKAYMEDGKMMVDVIFDDQSEKGAKIKSKVDRGFLNSVSVGFIERGSGQDGDEKKGENPELYYFDRQELLEVSVVNIPSNPDAKKKELRNQTFDALKYIYREIGVKRMSDIEDMTVREILDALEGEEIPEEKTNPIGEFNYRIVKAKQSALAGQ